MRIMNHSSSFRLFCFLLLVGAAFMAIGLAETPTNFAGSWALKIGDRTLMVLTLKQTPGSAGHFTGWLARPRKYESSGVGNFFSDINGPIVHYPIIESSVTGNCLAFTTQNPADMNDKHNFRLCPGAPGHATLRTDIPTFQPWPVTRDRGVVVVATNWDRSRTYFLGETSVSNEEMRQIFEADQKDRQGPIEKIDRAVVSKRDSARRKLVRQLLAQAKLHSGKDFERAAFVFQHGDKPDDYLLAHTLATVAVARGYGGAIWISAATLDRYLHSIHQPQIYGTQFEINPEGKVTQEPYNRHLISDTLRQDLGVPSQAEQRIQEKQYDKGRGK